MTRTPIDLPDPEPTGPTIWAAREIRQVDCVYPAESYRGYRAEYPTPGQAWAAVAMVVVVVLVVIGAMFAWALQ